jgi:ABC-type transport system involved in multi-copper enzyme maturation permease subunit
MTSPALTGQRVTQARVLRSEWTKLRSLASTAWSLLAAVVLIVGFGAMYCTVRVTRPPEDAAAAAAFDPAAVSLAGVQLAAIAIGVLGVLLITGEYATGMIRTSFAAVPRRLPILWGKAIAFALTTLTLCVPSALAAFLAGQSILSAENLDTALDQPGTLRAVIGSALYLTVIGLLGLQIIVGFLPENLSDDINRYLPVPAGVAVTYVRPDSLSLGPWAGFGVLCAYTALLLGLAAWRMRRRDA